MQRHRRNELLEALVTGREHLIEEAAQAWSTTRRDAPPEEAVREPVTRSTIPTPAPQPRRNARRELLDALSSRQALRRAILLHEVLGPPKALQPPG